MVNKFDGQQGLLDMDFITLVGTGGQVVQPAEQLSLARGMGPPDFHEHGTTCGVVPRGGRV